MILLQFNIRNPWSKTEEDRAWSYFRHLLNGSTLFKHKFWELELIHKSKNIVNFYFEITHCQSHAGFRFEIELLGYGFSFSIYDERHWDWNTNTWEKI